MTQIGEAFVRVRAVADTRSFEREAERALRSNARVRRDVANTNQEFARFSRGALVGTNALSGLGRAAAFASVSFLGGAGLVAGAKASVEAASNLNEQISKTNVVFGQASKGVLDWSNNTVTSMGLAKDQALATASSFGALFQPLGIVGQTAADQSERLTQLGADLASFYNTSVQDALDAIRSGLVGETEPLRRYGALLSEARVQQEALSETGKQSAAALTNQEKVLARINLIFRDTAKAQGDFERTSGGLANQSRILSANIRTLETNLGQALIPHLTTVVARTNKWLSNTENQQKITATFATSIDILAASFRGLAAAIELAGDARRGIQDLRDTAQDAAGPLKFLFIGPTQLGDLFGKAIFNVTDKLGLLDKATSNLTPPAFRIFSADARQYADALGDVLKQLQFVNAEGVEAAAKAASAVGVRGSQLSTAAAQTRLANAPSEVAQTAKALAQAQSEGTIAQIRAAAEAHIAAINNVIAFANKLLGSERGNAKELTETLTRLYGERASTQGIIQGILDDAARKQAQDAADRKARADKAAAAAAAQARLEAQSLAQARAQGKAFLDAFRDRIRQRAQEATDIRLLTLQDAQAAAQAIVAPQKRLVAERKADKALIEYFRARAHNAHVSALERRQALNDMRTAQRALDDLNAEARADARTAREAARETQFDIGQQILENALLQAGLIKNEKRRTAQEKTIQGVIVQSLKQRARQLGLDTLEGQRAQADYLRALKEYRDIGKKEKKEAAAMFTPQQFFAEAGQEFLNYGSNIGGRGAPLSVQEAGRAAVGIGVRKTSNTMIVQQFYGERSSAQALNDARAGARNLK